MNDKTAIRQLDAGSFREVYDQFNARIFRYFLKKAFRNDVATELTQQLFIRLWQSRHTLSSDHLLEVQLFTMANSVWIDHLRKEATSRKYFQPVADYEQVQDPVISYSFEASDHFQQAVKQLPPVRRKVFILKILHGFSNQEIAGQLSVSVKTVEDHLWKAMRFIRATITTLWSIAFMLL